ncbi:MAG: DUF4367 domain-containing protein [Lachnospiraceae bacterium]|jgi:hypothetical protein|uniref:DUF4367 domain-containing protein n=1 Tax=Candidatus Merdisoma sp. JLR.KK006 TaxID=3112626 RepID=UPI002FF09975|nr:DUF4367 domain-containing protein [Lachnospiraceae bacterium]
MEKEDLKERLTQEIETEALILERRVNTKKELASLEMPEDSYEQLMKRIREKEEAKARKRQLSRKALATAAMVMVLVTIVGVGVNGARLYVLNVENRKKNGKLDIVASTDDIFYVELTEKEAYEKIEEEIGILALRLSDKPQGMELGDVFIDTEMGEALMEFYYNNHILTIYENKQNKDASFITNLDGQVIDTIESFYLGKELEILKVNETNGKIVYQTQMEYANAFYYLSSDIELDEFENILCGIIFNNE